MKPKRMMIVGCGYVGRYLALEALRRGMHVSALTRNEDTAASLRQLGLDEVIVSNIEDKAWVQTAAHAGGLDCVVNTVSSSQPNLDGYRRSYITGMQRLLELSALCDLKHIIYTSSTGVYTQGNGQAVNEEDKTGGTERADILIEAEKILLSAASVQKATILRLVGIYGPGRHYMLNQLRDGKRCFAGAADDWLNLIFVQDVVSAVFKVYDEQKSLREVFNVSDGCPSRRSDVLGHLCRVLGLESVSFDPSIPRRVPSRQIESKYITEATSWQPTYINYRLGYDAIFREEEASSD